MYCGVFSKRIQKVSKLAKRSDQRPRFFVYPWPQERQFLINYAKNHDNPSLTIRGIGKKHFICQVVHIFGVIA